jgi:hypothetical protein
MFTSFQGFDAQCGEICTAGLIMKWGTNSLVITVRYSFRWKRAPECWVGLPYIWEGPHQYRGNGLSPNVTIILLPDDRDGDRKENPAWRVSPRPSGILWGVAEWLAQSPEPIPFTLVGVTEAPPILMGMSEPLPEAERRERILDDIIAGGVQHKLYGETFTADCQEKARSAISFYTTDEYRAKVGEEEWAIETVWPETWNEIELRKQEARQAK